jgi:glutathione synthase/RimK-type ligase-like ATP-grasp enzyme
MILFLRRPKLGKGSCVGMSTVLNSEYGEQATQCLHTRVPTDTPQPDLLVRWGCTAASPWSGSALYTLNKSSSIIMVSDKRGFRLRCQTTEPSIIPCSVFTVAEAADFFRMEPVYNSKLVVRPRTHSQGRNLWVVSTLRELVNVLHEHGLTDGMWYASELINKTKEYRVYFMRGRVVTVAEKTPADPTAVAWNVAQGGRFDVLPFGQWPTASIEVGYKAFMLSGLDFGGVDVMEDAEGRAYVIEINSAPSLPAISTGVSYRQRKMAAAIKWTADNYDTSFSLDRFESWRDVIHPSYNIETPEGEIG